MPTQPKAYFSKVREARELIQAEAANWVELHKKVVAAALAKGELEVALKAIQWMIEHTAADEGVTILDQSVDVAKPVDKGNKGPQIQIGIAFGPNTPKSLLPVNQAEALPSELVSIEEIHDPKPSKS